MSAFGDAIKAIREVLLMQSHIDQLDQRMARMGDDLTGLAELTGDLRDRIARLEGIIEGIGMASAAKRAPTKRLPKA